DTAAAMGHMHADLFQAERWCWGRSLMAMFSSRHGFEPQEAEIRVRNDAPYNLRGVVVDIAYEAGLDPHSMRTHADNRLLHVARARGPEQLDRVSKRRQRGPRPAG